MKHIYLLITTLFFGSVVFSQTTVTIDPAASWAGYMNVFNNDSGAQGSYLFGSSWGVTALKTTITGAGDATYADGAITLQPNFNAYDDAVTGGVQADIDYWTDGAGGGNKFLEASTLLDYSTNFTEGSLTFNGTVASNTISSEYTVIAYIKTLDPSAGYATVINQSVTLGATGTNFAVSANDINSSHILQIGFTVSGLNANPDDEATLGKVVITPNTAADVATADPAASWAGYMNVFNNDSGAQGSYLFGSSWGVTALKTTITGAGDATYADGAITLQPNFNAYDDAVTGGVQADIDYWTDGAGGGNKFLEASTLLDYSTNFTEGSLTFNGTVASNTISSEYTVIAYIKTLDPSAGYATVINQSVTLGATGTNFAVSANDINSSHILQIGFTVSGLNANPDDEATLGKVVVSPNTTVLSVKEYNKIDIVVYPNPVQNTLNVSAAARVDSVSIFDISGREVLTATPNAAAFSLDVATLNKGLYLVSLKAGDQEMTTKLVK